MAYTHPLHGITAAEITQATQLIWKVFGVSDPLERKSQGFRIKSIQINEPPKALLLPYLDAEARGVPATHRPFVPRCVSVIWVRNNEREFADSIISLDSGTEVYRYTPKKGEHSQLDRTESRNAGAKILGDSKTLAAVEKLNLPPNYVVQCDAWMWGADSTSTVDTHRFILGYLYARNGKHVDSNQYSWPLPFASLLDINTDEVVEIVPLATGGTEEKSALYTGGDRPMDHCVDNDYHHDLLPEPRTDLKALHVVQPDGPSFSVADENKVSWQKWRFRICFNLREGVVLQDVRYDGRPVFYRLSLSEMTVPYGDPRAPYHRKQAMDIGDVGGGRAANNLALGCDCLGLIKYFHTWIHDDEGTPIHHPNVVCLHEQDGGIGWKHTNFRTQGAGITRARVLVVQTILTVGNYEYIFAWHFSQNGSIELETRATGILSTTLIDAGKTSPWGNVVSPGVLATNHQHLFSMRVDPMLDGKNNSVIMEDSIPLPQSEENPEENAWTIEKQPFLRSGFADASPFTNRCFKMVNESVVNRISGNPVGYKLVPQPCQLIIAGKNSIARRRARFAEHHIWVTKYRDGDLYAGGRWTMQSLNETDGLYDYASRDEAVRNEDLVLWHTFGMTHNPRVEDFPVMPCEVHVVSLKPADFFEKNPALDVPQSIQSFNKSTLIANVEKEKDACCAKL